MRRTLITTVLLIGLLPATFSYAAPPENQPDPRREGDGDLFYGVNFVQPEEPWLTLARDAGVGVVRWQFNWRDHEPQPGQWNWEEPDQFIEAWLDAGIAVNVILHNPPDWALENPGGLMPINRDLAWDHPDNGWANYCYRFAERYRGRIYSYEIWNEPDLNDFWEGSPQDYYNIMKTCYQAIKAADPEVTVAMAGMILLIEPDFFPTVVSLAANDPEGPDNNFFFDVTNIHVYNYPPFAYQLTGQARWVLRENNIPPKPVWITETNIPIQNGQPDLPGWKSVTEVENGWYLLQTIAHAHAAGAEKMMVFRLFDGGMSQSFGLLRDDMSVRPGYTSYQIASRFMTDIVEAERISEGNLEKIIMRREDGSRVILLYTPTGHPAEVVVQAEQESAMLIMADGTSQTLQPGEGNAYQITLEAAPGRDLNRPAYEYRVGGPPVILLEGDITPPTAAMEPVRLTNDATQYELNLRAEDGATGTGVATYDIQVSWDNGATWELWAEDVTEERITFENPAGEYILARVRATDGSGNVGLFSEVVALGIKPVGVLEAVAYDLRAQQVPAIRLELDDGTLYDSVEGTINVELPPESITIAAVDGAGHGVAFPAEQVQVERGEVYERSYFLVPRQNLIENGGFTEQRAGWAVSSPGDVLVEAVSDEQVLTLHAARRPWGFTHASVPVDLTYVPEGVVSFFYRTEGLQGQLRLRVHGAAGSEIIWQAEPQVNFGRVWADLSPYAGQALTLRWEIVGVGGEASGLAQIDQVIVSNVPLLP